MKKTNAVFKVKMILQKFTYRGPKNEILLENRQS